MNNSLLPIWRPLHLPRQHSWVGEEKLPKFWPEARFTDQSFTIPDLESRESITPDCRRQRVIAVGTQVRDLLFCTLNIAATSLASFKTLAADSSSSSSHRVWLLTLLCSKSDLKSLQFPRSKSRGIGEEPVKGSTLWKHAQL